MLIERNVLCIQRILEPSYTRKEIPSIEILTASQNGVMTATNQNSELIVQEYAEEE